MNTSKNGRSKQSGYSHQDQANCKRAKSLIKLIDYSRSFDEGNIYPLNCTFITKKVDRVTWVGFGLW